MILLFVGASHLENFQYSTEISKIGANFPNFYISSEMFEKQNLENLEKLLETAQKLSKIVNILLSR